MATRRFCKILAVIILLGVAVPAPGQEWEMSASDWEMQVSLIGGYLSGGSIDNAVVNGERTKADTEGGWLVGVRIGMEQEMFGWELMLAESFADLDASSGEFGLERTRGHANMFLANLDLLLFPTGNDIGDGRIRPFLAIGPGLAYLDTSFDHADGTTMFGVNAGAGIKFLLGEDGNPVLRFDWRWHFYFAADAGLDEDLYRQELTMGIGFRF